MATVYNDHASGDAAGADFAPPPNWTGPVPVVDGQDGAWGPRITETVRVYRALKRAILAGRLRPGEPLQEVRIAAEFGASRTPIREAFQKLEGDGLLTIAPRRGAFVRQPTARDFFDINELRMILEPVAARTAAETLDAATVSSLRERLAAVALDSPNKGDFAALELLDREMHTTIAAAHRNARMIEIIEGLNDMMQIVREKDMRRRHRELHDSIGEILAALAARDQDAAESLLRRHISDFSGALRNLV